MSYRKRKLPPGAFWLAQKGHRPQFTSPDGKKHPAITQAFYDMVERMPKLDPWEFTPAAQRGTALLVPDLKEFYPRGLSATLHVATMAEQRHLNQLFQFIQLAISTAYYDGVKHGRDLLGQLAKGELSSKEFDDAAEEIQAGHLDKILREDEEANG